jgi:sigma-B regulation protein RsbU (phosphoserine phosphatase)
MFISCLCVKIDIKKGTVTIANAGHDAPIILDVNNEFIRSKEGELVIGVLDDTEYTQDEFPIENIDRMFLYTDGIAEAKSQDSLYGNQRIENIIRKSKGDSSKKIIEDLLKDINLFRDHSLQQDDETCIMIDFKLSV